jgi:hypothetical protein
MTEARDNGHSSFAHHCNTPRDRGNHVAEPLSHRHGKTPRSTPAPRSPAHHERSRMNFSLSAAGLAHQRPRPHSGRQLGFALLLTACASQLNAEPITKDDRAYLVAHLEMTREFVRDTTRGLTKEQWLHSPGAKQWSTAQCVEHLARTEEYVLQMVRERLLPATAPVLGAFPSLAKGGKQASEQAKRMGPTEDAWVLRWITDRPPRLKTPVQNRPPVEEIAPRDVIDDPQAVLAHFIKVRAATLEYMRTTNDDLRGHSANTSMGIFPQMPFSDGYQWLLRMSGHTERHLMQIHDIRRSAGFPVAKP